MHIFVFVYLFYSFKLFFLLLTIIQPFTPPFLCQPLCSDYLSFCLFCILFIFSLILFILCSLPMPFSFPALPSALLRSTAMFPFAFFVVLWLHHKLLLQPLKYFYSVVSILLCLCYLSVAPSLQTVTAFPHPSISILLSSFCLVAFSFSLVSSYLDLPSLGSVKHASPGMSLTHLYSSIKSICVSAPLLLYVIFSLFFL